MPREIGRLSALKVSRPMPAGLHPDGAGLYLQVSASGARSWVYRYEVHGRERQMGLGPLRDVSLAAARQEAARCRLQRQAGLDPIEVRKAERAQAHLEAAQTVSFREAAERYIATNQPGWRNAKHGAQWGATLERYAYPTIGSLSVRAIDTPLVLKVLEPIWTVKPETASRVRGRIEAVLDSSKSRGEREGENPARWRGHLENILPRRQKVRRVRHHPALPYMEIGTFIASLRREEGTGARALEFLILCAARTGEVIGCKWPEIDLDAKVWTVPPERTKSGRPHRVPLSPRAVEIIKEQRRLCDALEESLFVFPSRRRGKALSNGVFLALLGRMRHDEITSHGFRSCFRDWCSERTAYSREIAETALAHVVRDQTEAAYRRGDALDKRRRLMCDWAIWCARPVISDAKVVAIRS